MDEVVGGVDALQRPVQRRRIKNIPLHDLGSRLHFGSELVGISGKTAEVHTLPFQQGDQPPADVTAAASEQDDRLVGSLPEVGMVAESRLVTVRKTDRQLAYYDLGRSSREQAMTDRGANDGVAATTFDRDDP